MQRYHSHPALTCETCVLEAQSIARSNEKRWLTKQDATVARGPMHLGVEAGSHVRREHPSQVEVELVRYQAVDIPVRPPESMYADLNPDTHSGAGTMRNFNVIRSHEQGKSFDKIPNETGTRSDVSDGIMCARATLELYGSHVHHDSTGVSHTYLFPLVVSHPAARPPAEGCASRRVTLAPALAACDAAPNPAHPPPMTTTLTNIQKALIMEDGPAST